MAKKEKNTAGLSTPCAASPEKKMGEYSEWEVQDAFNNLMRAKEIEGNKDLMAQVRKVAGKKAGAIRSIAQLRAIANDQDGDEE